ncbi:MAG: hypothetical protein KME57_19820 [Scytonema hyalinum WJT4-NPBG1]|nr:hypothetical protein [Scytonema hyalinum WJT4-NPBG1]
MSNTCQWVRRVKIDVKINALGTGSTNRLLGVGVSRTTQLYNSDRMGLCNCICIFCCHRSKGAMARSAR